MFKKIFIFFVLLICLIFLDLKISSKNINALESGFKDYTISISERDLDHYGCVSIYSLKYNTGNDYFWFHYINGSNSSYFLFYQNNVLKVVDGSYNEITSFNLTTGLIQVVVDYDVQSLHLIIYELAYSFQENQTNEPILNGFTRTMKAFVDLGSNITGVWSAGDLNIRLGVNNVPFPNFLLNYCYFAYNESGNTTLLNNWVDNQFLNNLAINSAIHEGYLIGNENGYLDGFDDGEERGYSDGYSAGVSDGHDDGYNEGYVEGFDDGESAGYDAGYTDGESGNNAVHPLWAMIHDIAVGIGDILALKLGPGITIGTIIFVPLFFSALGLILWIWRRN